jgi:hypothetical protein
MPSRPHGITRFPLNGFSLNSEILYKIKTHILCPTTFFSKKSFRLGDNVEKYRGADKSLAGLTSRCIFFDGENISFDAILVIYIYK